MTRRVVVTGIGLISPLGHSVETTWEALKAGKSGVDKITRYDASTHNVQIAAEVKNWEPTDYLPGKEVRRRDRYQMFCYVAYREAIQQSGLELTDQQRARSSVIVGSAVGGVESFLTQSILVHESQDVRRVTPFGIPQLMANGASTMISIEMGAHGPSATMVSACATGADCIGLAYQMMQHGRVDRVVAGCGDAPIIPIGIGAFDRIGATSRLNDNPHMAMRPFDRDRTGLVFAEGAGVMILETLEDARKRGAPILAELVGYGSTTDAYHVTAPDPEGTGATNAICQALDEARINPQDIDYINAHGTATELNDVMETKAVKRAFGDHAYRIPISSTKSMTGHGMGMTAALEAVFCVLSLRDQVVPPTINLHNPDPLCDLDYVPNEARDVKMRYVMSNSFGFGGHNSSLIFKRFDD